MPKNKARSTELKPPKLEHLDGFCALCGERLLPDEIDDDLKHTFWGSTICCNCAALWRRWMAE